MFPSSIAWGYRNRIQLHWDGVRFGYFKHRSKTIVDIQSCEIAHTKISQQIPKLKKMLQDQGASVGTYEIRLTSDGRVVMGTRSAFGFRQVHEAQNQFLRNWVQNHAGAPQCVLDLYSGDGNLSESIGSPRICVDVATPSLASPKAVDVKTRWVHAAVGDWLKRPQSKKVASEADLLILDPPRFGLKHDIDSLMDVLSVSQCRKIIFIGCHTDSWARDLLNFERKQWQIQTVGVFDFFPQTHHVETAAVLERF